MGNITELLRARQFQSGLVDGVFALAVVLLCALTRLFGRRPPIVGALFAFAGVAALTGTGPGRRALDGVGFGCAFAVLLLFGGGLSSRALPGGLRLLLGPLLLAPGAIALGLAAHPHGVPWWAAVVLMVVVAPCGVLAADFDQHHGDHALGPLLLVITVAGLYVTVPDTEGARALMGVALPFVLVTLPGPLARLGTGGAAAAIGLVAYDAALEGIARPASMIGALGCIGLLACEPVGRHLRWRRHRPEPVARPEHLRIVAIAVVLQGVLVLWTSHVAGRVHSAPVAALLLAPAAIAGALAGALLL